MKPLPEQELAVQVAALLALYEWEGRTAEVVYIGVPEKGNSGRYNSFADPEDDLILALYDRGIDAQPFSEQNKSGRFIVDAKGRPSFFLTVSPIKWIGEARAKVEVTYMKGDRWGCSFRFLLNYDGASWSVTQQTFTGMF